jgi:protein-disulfide isomerase
MKTIFVVAAALLLASPTVAHEPTGTPLDEKTEKLVRQSLPTCSEMKLSRSDLTAKLPAGMTGSVIDAESRRHPCHGRFVAVTTSGGSFYLGIPWFIDAEGATIEEKLKNFAWTQAKQNVTVTLGRERTRDGLVPVTMTQTTESGGLPIEGEIDPQGKVFFMGHFRSAASDAATVRQKAFDRFVANAPARGTGAEVTIVEFSDFQCPSCKHSAGYVDPIMEQFPDKVRYVRYDLPLMFAHPWAFSAAVAGRAIHRQKPELFWTYKKQVYENQDKLSTFTIDDFARHFAQDRDLDMKRYDADIASKEIREELLKGVGAAFTHEVRSTPTYMINGVFVDAGDEGKALKEYVAGLLKKQG